MPNTKFPLFQRKCCKISYSSLQSSETNLVYYPMSSNIIKMSHWSFLDFHVTFSPLPWQSIEAEDPQRRCSFFPPHVFNSNFLLLSWIWSQCSKKTDLQTWCNLIKLRHVTRPIFLHDKSFIELGSEAVIQRWSVTKGVLRNFAKSQENICARVICFFIKKETLNFFLVVAFLGLW